MAKDAVTLPMVTKLPARMAGRALKTTVSEFMGSAGQKICSQITAQRGPPEKPGGPRRVALSRQEAGTNVEGGRAASAYLFRYFFCSSFQYGSAMSLR